MLNLRFYIFFVGIMLATIGSSYGQVVLTDDAKEIDILPKAGVFRDTTMLLSFADVKDRNVFQTGLDRIYLAYQEKSTLWIKVTITNNCLVKETFLLDTRNATINKVVFYEPTTDSTYQEKLTGDAYPYHYRAVETRGFTFELNIKEGETKTYYLHIDSQGDAINLPLKVWQPVEFLNKTANEKYVFGLYYGAIIFIIIFHIFLFTRLKDKTLIYYMLYVVGIGGLQLTFDGFSSKYLFPHLPWLVNRLLPAFIFLGCGSLIGFLQTYLNTLKTTPKMHQLLEVFKWASWLCMMLSFSYDYIFLFFLEFTNIFGPIVIILVIIGAIMAYKPNPLLARYFIFAFVFLILGAVAAALRNKGIILPGSEFGLKLGAGAEVIMLAIALAEKFKIMEEKANALALERLQNLNTLKDSYNRELEETVQLRTGELEKSNNNIKDSLRYAKRIQTSLLSSEELLNDHFSEHFLFYQPKDIVSGDFFWFNQKGDKFTIAAVDCTGHGVPGAFMSILGQNMLNEIVNSRSIYQPNEVLAELNHAVRKALKQTENGHSSSSSNDGMDVGMITYCLTHHTMSFSGARRPLYLFCNGELQVIKGSRFSIGGKKNQIKIFEEHQVNVKEGDTLYLFSDGYIDQFGGEDDRKFMAKRFQNLLTEIQDLPMATQRVHIQKTLNRWMGKRKQLDDILIVGIKL